MVNVLSVVGREDDKGVDKGVVVTCCCCSHVRDGVLSLSLIGVDVVNAIRLLSDEGFDGGPTPAGVLKRDDSSWRVLSDFVGVSSIVSSFPTYASNKSSKLSFFLEEEIERGNLSPEVGFSCSCDFCGRIGSFVMLEATGVESGEPVKRSPEGGRRRFLFTRGIGVSTSFKMVSGSSCKVNVSLGICSIILSSLCSFGRVSSKVKSKSADLSLRFGDLLSRFDDFLSSFCRREANMSTSGGGDSSSLFLSVGVTSTGVSESRTPAVLFMPTH